MNPFWPDGQAVLVTAEDGRPALFHWRARVHRVQHLSAHWRIHTKWWTENEIWRDYWQVATDTGLLAVLYANLLSGEWLLERIYE